MSVLDGSSRTVQVMEPSLTLSSTPATDTICAMFQVVDVKIRRVGDTVPSVVSRLSIVTVTFAVGCLVSSTVKVSVVPSSTVRPPATTTGTSRSYSSSALTAYTVSEEIASYLASPVAIWFTVSVTW